MEKNAKFLTDVKNTYCLEVSPIEWHVASHAILKFNLKLTSIYVQAFSNIAVIQHIVFVETLQ